MIQPRESGKEYSVTHHGDRFFITTNYAGQNFGLVETPVEHPSREHWSPVLPYRPVIAKFSRENWPTSLGSAAKHFRCSNCGSSPAYIGPMER